MKSLLPPRYTVPGVCFEAMTGASQSKRYGASPGAGRGVMPCVSPVTGSTRDRFPPDEDE